MDLHQIVEHVACLRVTEAEALLRPLTERGVESSSKVTALTLLAEVMWLRSLITEDARDIKEAAERLEQARGAALKGSERYRNSTSGSFFRSRSGQKAPLPSNKLEEISNCANLAYIYLMEALALFRGSLKGYVAGALKLRAAWRLFKHLGESELHLAIMSSKSDPIDLSALHAIDEGGPSETLPEPPSSTSHRLSGAKAGRRIWASKPPATSTEPGGDEGEDVSVAVINAQVMRRGDAGEEDVRKVVMADILYGVGGFHFFVSMVPASFKWVVESLGFRGEREVGRRELQKCMEGGGQRAPSALLLILWMDTFFYKDRANAEIMFARAALMFEGGGQSPSPLIQFMGGYLARVQGHLDIAFQRFERAEGAASQVSPLQQMCEYEMGWCCFLRCDFEEAIRYFEPFLQTFKGTSYRAYCAYQLGCALDMVGRGEEARAHMASVSKLVRKNYTYDQFAVRKAAQWLKNGRLLAFDKATLVLMNHLEVKNWGAALRALPSMRQLLPQATIRTHMIFENCPLLDPTSKLAADATGTEAAQILLEEVEVAEDTSGVYQYCVGRALRGLGRVLEAEECFSRLVEKATVIKDEIYILPFSYCDLGEIALEGDRLQEASAFLKIIKSKYHSFDFDKPLFRRLKWAQDKLTERLKNTDIKSHKAK
eukprot:TRINITY_DN789_c0_g1_i1.p1 TRINITY_DN789_c0_g1~~TRINITY_DN789_c0_g1_i1.p1  ORF type:complete len:657 (+),score=97.80 TRINITY_DN789_c0_g1_i1:1080-3050(+)